MTMKIIIMTMMMTTKKGKKYRHQFYIYPPSRSLLFDYKSMAAKAHMTRAPTLGALLKVAAPVNAGRAGPDGSNVIIGYFLACHGRI
ncbi:hypothetical protein L228DRAFT_106608 [Xylona heveae TC161]|uniref:Uncharacterized protein n=1 Tax=Xylona heveae (strain CBS 132557 / TC161) TaxID=1328760 RepID=A0A165HAR3_XYLHT|nr:hypothetical protein L228DRAFT_106608 [Xylona heveae TC161]KZF23224.1 hypothetical protein L228DRAFT_106608 [Xylona heveae TC161]